MPESTESIRDTFYTLLIILALGITTARIVAVERTFEPSMYRAESVESYRGMNAIQPPRSWPTKRPEPTPMFSSNDRSRWATVRALVDEGKFSIGERIVDANEKKGYRDVGIIFENDYASVDRILDPQSQLFYSSKPPLFTVVLAGEYWLLKQMFGWSIVEDRWPVVCTILITVNVLPLWLYFVLLRRLVERLAVHDWTKMIVFATGTLGTFLTTFSISLNNHVPAACCVMFAMYALLKVSDDERMGPFDFALSGLCAGWAFCLELPAASFVAGLGFLFLLRDVRGALLCYVPFALLPLVALALLNVIVTGDVLPAYAKFGGPWYEYPGSHWYQDPALPKKGGIDFAEEPLAIYAFHVLIGHHGLFSLTPIWLLSFAGMIVLTRQWFGERATFPAFGMVALGISVVVIAFYIGRSNNYGGFTGGLRWFFWLNPIWLITMVPILDRLALREWGRRLGYALLAITVFSVSYPMWNPWRHPWIYQLCEYTGWLVY